MAGPQPARPPARPNLLRCIIATILVLLIIAGVIVLIIWLVIRPAPIDYTIEKATVSKYNLSSSDALNATFDITIATTNHNKKISIYYDSMEVSVWYSGQVVAVVPDVPPFHQPKHNVSRIEVRPVASGVPLVRSVVQKLKRERSAGEANWEVRVEARVRFKVGAVKSRHYTLRADCSPVLVKFWSEKFQSVACEVDI